MDESGTRSLLGSLMAFHHSVCHHHLSLPGQLLPGSGVHCYDDHYNDCSRKLLKIINVSVTKSTGFGSYKPGREVEKGMHSVILSGLSLERSFIPGPKGKARVSGSPTCNPGPFV